MKGQLLWPIVEEENNDKPCGLFKYLYLISSHTINYVAFQASLSLCGLWYKGDTYLFSHIN
jgi:hypothetical protein